MQEDGWMHEVGYLAVRMSIFIGPPLSREASGLLDGWTDLFAGIFDRVYCRRLRELAFAARPPHRSL
jgi:hypothetical protein